MVTGHDPERRAVAPCRNETLSLLERARRVRRRHANIIPAAPEAVHTHCAVGEDAHTAVCIVRRPRPLNGRGHCEVRGLAYQRRKHGERCEEGMKATGCVRMASEERGGEGGQDGRRAYRGPRVCMAGVARGRAPRKWPGRGQASPQARHERPVPGNIGGERG
jgi:hypothetical protein